MLNKVTLNKKNNRDFTYKNLKQIEIGKYNNIPCIYGIYVNNNLLYIGSSTSPLKRFCQHKNHIIKHHVKFNKLNNDYLKVYIELREIYNNNLNIDFIIIEEVLTVDDLKKIEKWYINKYNPPLNENKY